MLSHNSLHNIEKVLKTKGEKTRGREADGVFLCQEAPDDFDSTVQFKDAVQEDLVASTGLVRSHVIKVKKQAKVTFHSDGETPACFVVCKCSLSGNGFYLPEKHACCFLKLHFMPIEF